jgi:SAM-dependent methyltransferase
MFDGVSPAADDSVRERTVEGFAYEWEHFGQPRPEWRKNFLDYMRPLTADWFAGKLILDVGAGSGRHSAQAFHLGARVVAVDLGDSIDVARRNLPDAVLTVQADAERLPFAPGSFDLVMSIGVLHHLEDTQRALSSLVRYVRPGGHLHVYLYWVPEIRWHRPLLKLVAQARRATVRLPYGVVHRLSYPLAAGLWAGLVLPHRFLRSHPLTSRVANTLPLKTYADYPFAVLVNDQFDRFSALIEQRFSRAQVQVMLERAGLEQVVTVPNNGWLGDGRRPKDSRRTRSHGISVIVTVRNDREGLRELLPGLANQTLMPDEILIIDGGSIDGTLDLLDGFSIPNAPIRVTVAPGTNIAAGRNIGIQLANNDLIACTDAGCRPSPEWLAALRRDLDHADLVGGVFIAHGQTTLEEIVSLTHYPVPDELDRPGAFVRVSHRLFGRQYLANRAGGRSMAFHRDVWRSVGGFPEIQYAGEDQAFARAIVDNGFKAKLAADAVVYWRPPGTWKANATMFFRYCRGDVRSPGRSRHVLRLLAWTAAPPTLARGGWRSRVLLLAGAAAYTALPARRARRAGLGLTSWWRIPVAVAVKDLAQIAGALRGTVDAARGVPQPVPHPPPIVDHAYQGELAGHFPCECIPRHPCNTQGH